MIEKTTINLAREYEYDRFLISLFAGQKLAEKIWVILALNSELTRIRDITNEPITGLIRLTWWRESVDEILNGKKARRQPTLQAFEKLVVEHNIDHVSTANLLDAHENLIEGLAIDESKQVINHEMLKLIEGISDKPLVTALTIRLDTFKQNYPQASVLRKIMFLTMQYLKLSIYKS